MPNSKKRIISILIGLSNIGLLVLLLLLLFQIPGYLLDLIIVLNLIFALLLFLIVLHTRKINRLSQFRSSILVSTFFSLILNIISAMLILYKGAAFDGYIIRFVSGLMFGSSGTKGLVISIIIYLVIVIFLVFVIARGTVRVAEAAARFSLDSLPGKQMTIENEYAQGAITKEERTAKMQELQQESDLYSAMEDASDFISNILKILITITVITALVGILISIIFHGETILDAAIIYVPLALSSGIISMLPLLLFSIAVIMMVTRTTSSGKSNEE